MARIQPPAPAGHDPLAAARAELAHAELEASHHEAEKARYTELANAADVACGIWAGHVSFWTSAVSQLDQLGTPPASATVHAAGPQYPPAPKKRSTGATAPYVDRGPQHAAVLEVIAAAPGGIHVNAIKGALKDIEGRQIGISATHLTKPKGGKPGPVRQAPELGTGYYVLTDEERARRAAAPAAQTGMDLNQGTNGAAPVAEPEQPVVAEQPAAEVDQTLVAPQPA